ncbi:MAG: hypothetical protein PUD93_05955 [Lachnospiraceae bacterium]|nr:hypothetical protein [Lachnospiraceae bacterium]
MKFYKKLYIGDTIKKPNQIKRKLKRYDKLPTIYVIALASGKDQLEIYHSLLLQQPYYKEKETYIVGIAGNYEEAVSLVCRITEEAVLKNGTADLKKYLSGQVKSERKA